jgi:general L-amino acid transport system permease protein
MSPRSKPPQLATSSIPFWRTQAYWQGVLQLFLQLLVLAVVGGCLIFLLNNIWQNLQQSGLGLSFAPFHYQAGFEIGETAIAYDPRYSYWRALLVGLVNSLRVIGLGILLASLLGVTAGVASFSSNWLIRQLVTVYIETVRNLPLLVQLLFWYFVVFLGLPTEGNFLGLILSRNGLQLWGGLQLSPEFTSILIGLTVYTGTFIAEIVRGGIRSVPNGQREAAWSLGLTPMQTMRLVILPQALRVIIPSLSNQYLNLAKNSSLAIAVGYPDLFSVASTTYNQTGRAVEVMIVIMGCYLTISLVIAMVLNLYNRRVQLVSR